ncbi:mRNA-decapping enzyme-like protein [Dendrobium catenatum]|uniref:mRNA-decapping enzyme-like protein n=1 Tax=Dendrobium catenatum TaxID=906689 RepID=A0A2I0XBF7_9ASPA|nr:mRNA-decapping enzyme-like protein [Dendrobium catenatum]
MKADKRETQKKIEKKAYVCSRPKEFLHTSNLPTHCGQHKRSLRSKITDISDFDRRIMKKIRFFRLLILNAFSKAHPKSKVPANKSSEFEELEATPSLSVIEGPLEPQIASSAAVPDVSEESFVNFFSTGMSIGNVSNTTIPGSLHQSSTPTPHTPSVPLPLVSTIQTAPSLPSSSPPLMSVLDTLEANGGNNLITSLVKPSLFAPSPSSSALLMPPISSSVPTAPPLHPPVTMQRPYGTPLLQPFPPPNPPPSLTPTQNYGSVITRDKVRDALLRLVQFFNLIFANSEQSIHRLGVSGDAQFSLSIAELKHVYFNGCRRFVS